MEFDFKRYEFNYEQIFMKHIFSVKAWTKANRTRETNAQTISSGANTLPAQFREEWDASS